MKRASLFKQITKFKKNKLFAKQSLVVVVAMVGLVIGSFAFAKTVNFSGTLDMNGNGIANVNADQAMRFRDSHAYITVHDGQGNFNILSGVDDNNTIVSSDGGTRLELNDNGWVDIEILSGAGGNSGSVSCSYLFNSTELDAGNCDICNASTVEADTYTSPSCDLAEYYRLEDTDSNVEAGDIVVMSRDSDTIKKSGQPYDKLVLGIVSTDPAISIGETEEVKNNLKGHSSIALVGRVPAKVTAENGPIEAGDIIVTSSKPGYGMKCDDPAKCRRAVVGKALTELKEGEGKIKVLINHGF